MNAFEQARQKHAKNLERRTRAQEKDPVIAAPKPQIAVLLAPKERRSDAVISVTVSLPSGEFSFRFLKRDVLSNVPNHRLTRQEFKRAIVDGLVPLMGRVDELSGGG